jgi:hypothetical protein
LRGLPLQEAGDRVGARSAAPAIATAPHPPRGEARVAPVQHGYEPEPLHDAGQVPIARQLPPHRDESGYAGDNLTLLVDG